MKSTIKELQEEIQAKGQLIIDKNQEISKQCREIADLKSQSQRFEDRVYTLQREIESQFTKEKTIIKIINGKSKPVSKIEVLKDLINSPPPRPLF